MVRIALRDRVARMTPPVALVTGAGGGIGTALCRELANSGYRVIGADRPGSALPSDTESIEIDLRSSELCHEAISAVGDRHGRLDLLVNNAGINARGNAESMPEAQWQQVVDVNLSGTFRMCQIAHALLKDSRGSVVNLSSSAALVAIAGSAMYGVTKAAISHLTRVLAVEWAADAIRVNAVAPTIVATAMTADVLEDEAYMKSKIASIPLGRLVTPEEVATVVRWLASAEATMITGLTVPVDGGVSLL